MSVPGFLVGQAIREGEYGYAARQARDLGIRLSGDESLDDLHSMIKEAQRRIEEEKKRQERNEERAKSGLPPE